MKYLLIFWGGPVGILLLWYFLSINDVSFGFTFLSRDANNYAFELYGLILGLEPDAIRQMFKQSILIDMVLIAALTYFKPQKYLKNWWKNYKIEVSLLGKSSFFEKLALVKQLGLFKTPVPLPPVSLQGEMGFLPQSACQDVENTHGVALLSSPVKENSLSSAP